jgi:sigma-B regulation protein RsbU (phosphoserine phosphatase)
MHDMTRRVGLLGDFQRHLLPRRVPEPDGWRVAVHSAVGRWPGGDYYDFLPLPDGRLLTVVADASDHGAPAALAAMARVVLHACPLSSGVERLPFCPFHDPLVQPPHVLLGHLNHVLAENAPPGHYLTAFCGVLDPVDGNLHYSNAGHPAPRWWRARTRTVEPLRDAVGQALGLDARSAYHHRRVELEPGDLLVLYTDGLTAAPDDRGEPFGVEAVDAAVAQAAARGGAETVKNWILTTLEAFRGRRETPDDVTLVIFERLA